MHLNSPAPGWALRLACTLLLGSSVSMAFADERLVFFESKIRPLLEKYCIECHRGSDAASGLQWTHRMGWADAAVIEPGRPEASLVMQVLRSEDPDALMPPPDSNLVMSQDDIRLMEQWIADGALDPRELDGEEKESGTGPKKRNRVFEITPDDRSYWAFQPLAEIENKENASSTRSASQRIDDLIEQRLTAIPSGYMSPLATPREQVRRIHFDLWGLPPSPEIVASFEAEPSDDAWEDMIESLLRSHHYGERWGRFWLDWVRYAETNGYERDGQKPHAWRYRDYVIQSFAEDKPYDQFLIEQLAGDEWAQEQGWSANEQPERWREAIIATGFYRLHQFDDEPDDSEVAEFDEADDVLIAIGTTMLGLTVGCARCHDHKFDPISQRDYYSLLSFLRGIDPYGLSKKGGGGRGTGRIQRFLVSDEVSQSWEQERTRKLAELRQRLDQAADPAVRLGIEGEIQQHQNAVPPFEAALAAIEIPEGPKPTHVLHRGDVASPREPVEPAVPEIFVEQIDAPKSERGYAGSSGRRLRLARWIANPEHPLTARVMVNRIWQRHFGVGIVPTPDDFGRTGMPPTNLPLLDFLAAELIRSGWSVHHVHRIILKSHAYRMTSRARNTIAASVDPEGGLFWRQNLRRLDAEAIRDSILAISGNLGAKREGPSVFPTLSQEVRDAANPVSLAQWTESPAEEQNCRSVYLSVKRSLKVPFLETLDFANSSSPAGIRSVTTTAPQALLLLNDPWVHQQARQWLQRVRSETGGREDAMLERLWKLAYQRSLSDAERQAAMRFLAEQSALASQRAVGDASKAPNPDAAWESLCRTLLGSNETIYID